MNIYKAKSSLRAVVQWLESAVRLIGQPHKSEELIKSCDQWLMIHDPQLMEAYGMCVMNAQGQGSLNSSTAEYNKAMEMGANLVQAVLDLPANPPSNRQKALLHKLSNYERPQLNFDPTFNNFNNYNMPPNSGFGYGYPEAQWGPVPRVRSGGCDYCGLNHRLVKCKAFRSLRHQKRRAIASKRFWCFRCLGQHSLDQCASKVACYRCGGNHHEILCRPRDGPGELPSRRMRKKMAAAEAAKDNGNVADAGNSAGSDGTASQAAA